MHRSAGDLVLLTAIGALGYGLRRAGHAVAPVMIGLILGPAADQQLRRALAISDGDWSVLVTRPIAAGCCCSRWRFCSGGLDVRQLRSGLACVPLVFAVASLSPAQTPAPTPGIHYTPTRHVIADAMLELAQVGPADVVFDLGSGDGRIPIIAAQKYGARGVGIELDAKLIEQSRQNARDAGVEARVTFIRGDLFTADVSTATVVALYLSPSMNRELAPKLQKELKPGARVMSHQFPIVGWTAAERVTRDGAEIFLYRVSPR